MKRKFLLIRKETDENGREKDEDEGGEEEEDEESDDGNGEEKHPPPPKKARLSTEAEEETVDGADALPNAGRTTALSQKPIKTEPTEEGQKVNSKSGCSSVDSDNEHSTIKKASSVDIVSSLPTLSPNATEVPSAFYPDNHPVPVPPSLCSHCASAKSLCVTFPADLLAYFKNASQNGAFQSLLESVPNISIEVDDTDTEPVLIVKSFSSTAVEKVRMLADAFVENSRLRQKMLRKREDNSKWSFTNFESNMFDANFLVEIEVSLAYLGLAFGKNRSNLAAARALYGIREITVDESQKAQGICKFKIYANTSEAADTARKLLEFADRKVPMPSSAIGRLIGKHSRNITDIVTKSGVVRIFVEKEKNEDDNSTNFVLIGTADKIANAEMMLNFHLWHIRERDDFDEERDELEREYALEKSSLADASASVAGHRNYDNTAFDHWTLAKAPSTDGSLCSKARANNNNRLPRPIFGRANRRHCHNGTDGGGGGGGRWNGFSMGIASSPLALATNNNNSLCYYQQPLAATKGQFSGGWAHSAETDVKPSNCTGQKPQHYGSRWDSSRHFH
ncbi:hypothetical protein niasHS_013580 [Heterodera schachtii]|uniref:K Homology domain-containing protein n=1 Tax=Heterodera schachtii TaxID=97005 RepID=A0ABD2I7A3_HETSC